MYKHCTTEESALRQRQFENSLLELMNTVPYSNITIGQICHQLNVSRKSFYRYFGSKDGCLCALLDHTIMDGASYYIPEQPNTPNTHQIYERFFTYWHRMSPLLDVLSRNNLSLHLVERMVIYMNEEEQDFQHYLGGRANDSYEQMLFMISGIMGLILNWHHGGYQKSISQMASILEKVIQS